MDNESLFVITYFSRICIVGERESEEEKERGTETGHMPQ